MGTKLKAGGKKIEKAERPLISGIATGVEAVREDGTPPRPEISGLELKRPRTSQGGGNGLCDCVCRIAVKLTCHELTPFYTETPGKPCNCPAP